MIIPTSSRNGKIYRECRGIRFEDGLQRNSALDMEMAKSEKASGDGAAVIELEMGNKKQRGIFERLRISDIDIVDDNPRRDVGDLDDLERSIKKHGLLMPIMVTRNPTTGGKPYLLVAGKRRLKAIKRLAWKEVPAQIREDVAKNIRAASLAENDGRKDLTDMEIASALKEMTTGKNGLSVPDAATECGMSKTRAYDYLELLKAPEAIQKMVSKGDLSMQAAIHAVKQGEDVQGKVAPKMTVKDIDALARKVADESDDGEETTMAKSKSKKKETGRPKLDDLNYGNRSKGDIRLLVDSAISDYTTEKGKKFLFAAGVLGMYLYTKCAIDDQAHILLLGAEAYDPSADGGEIGKRRTKEIHEWIASRVEKLKQLEAEGGELEEETAEAKPAKKSKSKKSKSKKGKDASAESPADADETIDDADADDGDDEETIDDAE